VVTSQRCNKLGGTRGWKGESVFNGDRALVWGDGSLLKMGVDGGTQQKVANASELCTEKR
jgi:hypothetical protein